MSVTIDYNGNIGNCFFQYVFARMLAEKNEMYLRTPFPYQKLVQSTSHRNGRIFSNPIVVHEEPYFSESLFSTNFNHSKEIFLSFYKLLNEPLEPANHVLRGYFEYSEIYNANFELIRSFFDLDRVNVNYKDIVINIRLGDFGKHGRVVRPEWYLNILENESFEKLFIVGCDPSEDYLIPFLKYNPVVLPSDPFNDFHTIRSFDRVICSNSTFCWWAAFLGEASRIYLSDQWLSPNINSCRNSVVVGADKPIFYEPRFQYSQPGSLRSAAEKLEMAIDQFILISDDDVGRILNQFFGFLEKCVADRDRGDSIVVNFQIQNRFSKQLKISCDNTSLRNDLPGGCDVSVSFFDWRTCIDYFIYNQHIPTLLESGYISVVSIVVEFYSRIELRASERLQIHNTLTKLYTNGRKFDFFRVGSIGDFSEILRNEPLVCIGYFDDRNLYSNNVKIVFFKDSENFELIKLQLDTLGVERYGTIILTELVQEFCSLNKMNDYSANPTVGDIVFNFGSMTKYFINSIDVILRFFAESPCRYLFLNGYIVSK